MWAIYGLVKLKHTINNRRGVDLGSGERKKNNMCEDALVGCNVRMISGTPV